MKRTHILLNALTERNYLYGKNKKAGLGYVLERNIPISKDTPKKKYRLITLGKGGKITHSHYFDLEESHDFMAPSDMLP